MKKWYIGILIASLFMLLILTYGVKKNHVSEYYHTSPIIYNTTNPLEWILSGAPPAVHNPKNGSKVISEDTIISSLFDQRNISNEEQKNFQTWNHLKQLIGNAQVLPNAVEAIKEAGIAWNSLMASVEEEKLSYRNESSHRRGKEKQCPHFLNKMNATGLDNSGFKLQVPCGLTQGSSITTIGIPSGLLGNFRIDLTGEPLPGEPEPPIILHYNVRLHGDKITEDPVIVQNTWTVAHDWGEEERCPSPDPEKNEKVDELYQCNKMVGKDNNRVLAAGRHSNGTRKLPMVPEGSKMRKYFPFNQGYLSVATLRVGAEGIQMTVDGKHHKNQIVNEELCSEALTYRDIQLMPFVDYYTLITWKTLAICIFAVMYCISLARRILCASSSLTSSLGQTEVVSTKFVMKTDDDTFVRVDEVLASLNRINVTYGLLYGLINSDSQPHRNPDNKWYTSHEEWGDERYPPWAHGPGYAVSHDIAKAVYKRHKKGSLKMFKLEDVAMGIWIADMKKGGLEVRYEKEGRIFTEGCKDGYVVAHYQGPREMLCLWQKLQETKRVRCCGE